MHISNNYHTIPIMSYCGKNTSIPQNLTTRANMPALVSTDPVTNKEAVIPIAYKDGSRMSTFRADSYSQDNPVYTVKYWDGNGNYTEEEIDGSKVDPSNASVLELLAFGSYCTDRGYPEDAVSNVMMAMVGVDQEPKFYSLDEALEKHNFTERMKDCVDITNNPAYMIVHLKYKAMYEFMLERSAENGGLKKEQEHIMIVSGISSVISPTTTANNIKDIPPFLSERANQPPLIYNDPDSGKEAIYACAWNYGSQMSVYYSDSFSKENPVFTVKIWDKDNGYVTQDIDGSKVDPTNATALELLAFGAYCDDRGYPEDATMCVGQMLAGADMDPVQYDAASSQIKHDFTVPLKEHMELTNHPAYMFYYVRYKAMYDFIKERPDINSINRIKLPYMERGYY